jgi:hypothetical protein
MLNFLNNKHHINERHYPWQLGQNILAVVLQFYSLSYRISLFFAHIE